MTNNRRASVRCPERLLFDRTIGAERRRQAAGMTSGDEQLRETTFREVLRLPPHVRMGVADQVIKRLDSRRSEVRTRAEHALVAIGDPAVPALTRRLGLAITPREN